MILNLGLYLTFPKVPEFDASFYWVIWCNLHFCILAEWAMAACQMWTTAVLVCCAFQRRYSCGNRTLQGRKEQNKTTEGQLILFEEVSTSVTFHWNITQLFLVADELCGSKTSPAVVDSHHEGKPRRGGRAKGNKMREKWEKELHRWDRFSRRGQERRGRRLKIKRRGREV